MAWIKKRLTPNKDEIREDFAEMVKAMSTAVPKAVKESDIALEQYRFHLQAAKDIAEVRKNLKGKIAALKASPPKYVGAGKSNYLEGIKILEESIDHEIEAHESLKRAFMLQYSTKDQAKKDDLKQKLPGLEALVDTLMFTRMRWDIHQQERRRSIGTN